MSKNTEIELKLVVSKENLKKLLELDFVAAAIRKDSKKKRKLISSYYDTEDMVFKQHGIAYRVRDKGDGSFEATVKTTRRNSAGLSERLELNIPLEKDMAVLDGFEELGLEQSLKELAPNGVEKLFKVCVERTTYILDLDGAVAELAIDNGYIAMGRKKDKIDEIEIELLDGNKGALLDFAARIAAKVPMFVEKRSKFGRGLVLRGLEVDEDSAKTKISGNDSQESFMAVVQQHCDRLLECQRLLLANEIDESVLKSTKRELSYLRSLTACMGVLLEQSISDDLESAVKEWQSKVERCLNLIELQEMWEVIVGASPELLAKNSLEKRLDITYIECLQSLIELAKAGSMTGAVFGVISWLYNSKVENNDYLNAQNIADSCLDKWLSSKKDAEAVDEKLLYVENMLYLAKSMSGKVYAREAEVLKKNRRKLQERVGLQYKQELLVELMEKSTSKVLYRDCGIVLGQLLSKK